MNIVVCWAVYIDKNVCTVMDKGEGTDASVCNCTHVEESICTLMDKGEGTVRYL